MKKKIVLFCLMIVLAILFCTPAFAAESGTCGDNLTWTLDDNGALTISGTGAMKNWNSSSSLPWGDTDIYGRNTTVKTIVINEGVTSIGAHAFDSLSVLSGISIPQSVTSIGAYAFNYCVNLSNISLPSELTAIGERAFFGCSSLKGISIPRNVTSLESYTFYGCTKMSTVSIEEGLASIADNVFYNCSALTSVTIPKSVTSIGDSAFDSCSSLTGITIPEGVSHIGRRAFYGCKGLKSVAVPAGVTNIGELSFMSCSNLTSVALSEGIATIGASAFSGCSSLTSITIPQSVTSIGTTAFKSCYNLSEITFIGGVPTISSDAFTNVTADACYPANNSTWTSDKLQKYGGTLTWKAYCPNDAHTYENGVCTGCGQAEPLVASGTCGDGVVWTLNSSGVLTISGTGPMTNWSSNQEVPWKGYTSTITKLIIEEGVTHIGANAFWLPELTSVSIPSGVVSIGDGAFSYCFNIPTIVLPEGVMTIGNKAFQECFALETVVIPESVTSIGSYAFYRCALKELQLPDGLTVIKEAAFSCLINLTDIVIPKNVTSIEANAFSSCRALTQITIPDKVESIGDYAFSGNSALQSIVFTGNAPDFASNAFYSFEKDVYYPAANVSWTQEVRQPYGGNPIWKMYNSVPGDTPSDEQNTSQKSYSSDVKGTYISGQFSSTVYSIDIEWSSLAFTYCGASAQVWDPETHSYTGVNRPAGWQTSDAKITVTNHSNASVHALPSYTADAAHTDAWVEFDTVAALVPSAAVSNRAEVAAIGVAPRGSFTQPQSASIGTVTVTVRRAMDDTTAPELRARISELQQAYHVVQDPAGLPEGVPYILQSDLDAALSNAAALDNAIDSWDGTAEQLDVLYTQYYLAQLQAINELVRTYHA